LTQLLEVLHQVHLLGIEKNRIYTQIVARWSAVFLTALLVLCVCQPAAQSRSALVNSPGQERVFQIDKEVMLTLVEFSRFNTRFQQEANRHQKWRNYLYPIMQETGTSLSFSNTLIDLRQRAQGLDNLSEVSKGAQKGGFCLAITGAAIGGTSSAMELAQNSWVMWRARGMGFSPKRSVEFVREKTRKIDTLLAERQQYQKQEPNESNKRILALEGRLLRHIRDQLVYEFRKWSAQSREIAWRENVFFAVDAAQNFTTFTSNMFSLGGINTNPSLRGTSAICALTANSMAMLNPPFRTTVGILVRKYQKNKLMKEFPVSRPEIADALFADWQDLQEFKDSHGEVAEGQRSLEEASFLFRRSAEEDDELLREINNIDKLRRVAGQQAISGPIIGMASVARSTMATTAYYGYQNNPVSANRLAFAGRLSQSVGQTYSLIATPTAQIKGYINKKRLIQQHQLPAQILKDRLEELDALQARIQASHMR